MIVPVEHIGYDKLFQGLGWHVVPDVDGSFHLEHSGGGPGFAAGMRLYPERRFGMVIVANCTYLPSKGIFDPVASRDW